MAAVRMLMSIELRSDVGDDGNLWVELGWATETRRTSCTPGAIKRAYATSG